MNRNEIVCMVESWFYQAGYRIKVAPVPAKENRFMIGGLSGVYVMRYYSLIELLQMATGVIKAPTLLKRWKSN